jgi:hypothetical protein
MQEMLLVGMCLKDNPEKYHFTKLTFSSLLKETLLSLFFEESASSLRLLNFIVVGSHGYFTDRFLIFNFSSLTEPEGVRK